MFKSIKHALVMMAMWLGANCLLLFVLWLVLTFTQFKALIQHYWFALFIVNIALVCVLVIYRFFSDSILPSTAAVKESPPSVKLKHQQEAKLNHALLGVDEQYHVFAILALPLHVCLPEKFTFQLYQALCRAFNGCSYCSVNPLKNNRFSISMEGISASQLDDIEESFAVLLKVLLCDVQCKVGICSYHKGAQQLEVYQLAESALALCQGSHWLLAHRVAYSHAQVELLQISVDEVMEHLAKKRYLLLFQPVFSSCGEAILHHEVLLRVRHKTLGLINTRQFLAQLENTALAQQLDLSVIERVMATLENETSMELLHINLTLSSWLDKPYLISLLSLIKQHHHDIKLTFEIGEDDYITYYEQLIESTQAVKKCGFDVCIDQVSGTLCKLSINSDISCIKVDPSLVCDIEMDEDKQHLLMQIAQFAEQHQLTLLASGVENKTQLEILMQFGVIGAQGHLYSEPLEEISSFIRAC